MIGNKFVQHLKNAKKGLTIGMVHVPSLPGTPNNVLSVQSILDHVRKEVTIYEKAKVDGIILENMFDLPYLHGSKIGPEITATMAACAMVTRDVFGSKPRPFLGIQILAGANKEALSVAHAADFDFIRAEAFVYSHVADEGIMNACAGELLRFRKHIGSNVAVLTDIKKKHCSHAITSDLSTAECVEAAEFFGADGVIITGSATGKEADASEIEKIKKVSKLPIFIGSGVTSTNLNRYKHASGFIVGSYFKTGGHWSGQLELAKIAQFVNKVKGN
uniref:BtpA/SgcQ family protein n=1 Tax=Rhabditophanes sp. KR3021 TaxID=114890 RepID=A0AC35U286_9BILA